MFPERYLKQTVMHARQGDVLLRQGEQQGNIFFLLQGIVRAVHVLPDGTERVKEFYFAGEYCFLYLSWLARVPSRYSLQAIAPCSYQQLPLAYLDTSEGAELADALLRQQLIYKERKEEMMLLHAPEKRYAYVLEHFPEWSKRLTQRELANYIGITPVSLSRIRQRINKG
ncbi:Crp/Fnr family transcriptional regulator [Pantoea sp. FN0305]|uniref:Crp/Fnr family transcriptional regulator n=1 Tax=Pantoea sp. FN0305 TaxID=3418559 RepID=UPI003CF0CA0C